MEKKNILNFKIGLGFSDILGNLAQEKLVYNLDPEKAINIFKTTLGITDEELIYKLISGREYCLRIDEENQEVEVVERQKFPESTYPVFDSDWYISNWITESFDDCNFLLKIINKYDKSDMRNNASGLKVDITVSLDLAEFINLISTKSDQTVDRVYESIMERYDSREEDFISGFVAFSELMVQCKTWLLGTAKKLNVIKFITASGISLGDYKNKLSDLRFKMATLYNSLSSLMKSVDLNEILDSYKEELKGFIIDDLEFRSFLNHKILPTDITLGYDAGWLSPEGDFYGMNGDMDNMLHNQLSDLLFEEGIIPKDYEISKDSWLEEHGWVKIHNDWILFDPYEYDKTDYQFKIKRYMTKEQVNEIYKYGKSVYSGFLKFGYLHTKISMTNFMALSDASRSMMFKIFKI